MEVLRCTRGGLVQFRGGSGAQQSFPFSRSNTSGGSAALKVSADKFQNLSRSFLSSVTTRQFGKYVKGARQVGDDVLNDMLGALIADC